MRVTQDDFDNSETAPTAAKQLGITTNRLQKLLLVGEIPFWVVRCSTVDDTLVMVRREHIADYRSKHG